MEKIDWIDDAEDQCLNIIENLNPAEKLQEMNLTEILDKLRQEPGRGEEILKGFILDFSSKVKEQQKLSFLGLCRKQLEKNRELEKYIGEMEKTFRMVGKQNLALSYFYQASNLLSSHLDEDQIISLIVEMVQNIFDEGLCAFLKVEDSGILKMLQVGHSDHEEIIKFFNSKVKMRVGEGCEGYCIWERTPNQMVDVYQEEDYEKFLFFAEIFNITSVMAVPLVMKGNSYGSIVIYSFQKRYFEEEEIQILSLFAERASSALEIARLYKQTDDDLKIRVKELSLMHEIDQAIITNARIIDVVKSVQSRLEDIFPQTALSFNLSFMEEKIAINNDVFNQLNIPPDQYQRILNRIHSEGNKFSGSFTKGTKIINYWAFPIQQMFNTLGFLAVFMPYPQEIKGENIRFLEWLLAQISIALEKARIQQQLIQSEKLNVMGQMLSGIAHELNNPLSRILGLSELSKSEPDIKRIREYNNHIFDESLRCKRIIEDFLAFARKYRPKKIQGDINSLIDKTINLWRYQKKTEDMKIVQNVSSGLPPVEIDEHRIQQVLLNLIINAYHAQKDNPPGYKVLRIYTSLRGERIYIAFEDSGPGIPENIIHKIFEPFFTTKPEGVGTGLGLSLSEGIIKEHGGEISCENIPGGGARFVILLPYTQPKEEEVIAPVQTPSTRIEIKDILIVDDDPMIRKIMKLILQKDGYRIATAQSGKECINILEKQPHYDLIFSDMIMPDISGEELLEYLEKNSPQLIPRLIFCTGDILDKQRKDRYDAQGIGVLYKPFEIHELKKSLESAQNRLNSRFK